MSIYAKIPIKEMPNSCTECPMGKRYGHVGDVFCNVLKDYFTGNVRPPYKERPDECPLIEIEYEELLEYKWKYEELCK